MADREMLKKWARRKIEKGMPEERVKKTLEERGEDPSIVDELKDPFNEEDGETEESDEEETGEEDSGEKKEVQGDIPPEQDFSKPQAPHWDVAASVVLLLLLAATGFAAQDFNTVSGAVSGIDFLEGCPEAGIAVLEAETSNGTTSAEVAVTNEEIELEVLMYRQGETVYMEEIILEGSTEVVADETADTVEARSLQCPDIRDERTVG